MWQEVSKNLIKLIYENKDKKLFSVFMPANSLEISNGLKMLEYIFTEEKNNFFPENFNFSKHTFNVENKRISFFVRMTAYVNILCSLERIIEKTYEEFRSSVKKLGYKKKLPEIKNKLKNRRKEIENFKFWRDKVFAHTAYTNPNKYFFNPKFIESLGLCEKCKKKLKEKNKEDIENNSTRLTALAYFGGTILGYGKRSFQIGGAGKKVENIEPLSFPVIDIAENHFKVMDHFKKWEEMFVEILKRFKSIDKKDIMEKNKDIKKIIF